MYMIHARRMISGKVKMPEGTFILHARRVVDEHMSIRLFSSASTRISDQLDLF